MVDYHAITVPYEPAMLVRRRREMAVSLLAAGIDPAVCTLFVQSDVPEHTELAWIFNTVTPLGELERQTQFKDKSGRQESVSAGLLNYPVLQAADILLYRADLVPVGEDQVQHLELSRVIARRWNGQFDGGADPGFFPEPQPLLTPTRRVMGLAGQAKMSKSLGNTVGLLEEPKAIWEKLRPAVTDPARIRKTDPGTPEVCNLFRFHELVSSPEVRARVDHECRNAIIGCVQDKKLLADILVDYLAPFRARREQLLRDPDTLRDVLVEGSRKARLRAQETMELVRAAVKLDYLAARKAVVM